MANLNVRRLTPFEAQRLRGAAAARGETMKQYVLNSGALRADLDRAVRVLLDASLRIPPCPFSDGASVHAWDVSPQTMEAHIRLCPICSATVVQQLVGPTPAIGWMDLARDLDVPLADLPAVTARFARLAERERAVLADLYGLTVGLTVGGVPRPRASAAEIARKSGVSRERVRQVADRAKAALREGSPPLAAPGVRSSTPRTATGRTRPRRRGRPSPR